jgi:hypothetical protein
MRSVAYAATMAVLVLGMGACKKPMAKIESLRDALARGDSAAIESATGGLPTCPDLPPVAVAPGASSPRDHGCLAEIATALGSKKGFSPKPPDHAAAATAAVVVTRDGRGDWLAHADSWLGTMKSGKGPGPDALRLAVARRMAEGASHVGRRLEEEAESRAAMKAVAAAIPGACPTYWLLGTDAKSISAELTADHAVCVRHDLSRREGMGPGYGSGLPRALEGALALWREAERALRLGASQSTGEVKTQLEQDLAIIEKATRAIATKKLEATRSQEVLDFLGEAHADAGIVLWPDAGGGAPDAEGGAPAP